MTAEQQRSPLTGVKSIEAMARDVRRLVSRTYQHEFTGSMWIEEFRPRYEVEGRRRNGSLKGQHRLRWLLGRIVLPIWAIVAGVITVVMDGSPSILTRKSVVRGGPNCQALAFADANKSEQQSLLPDALWLVFSQERAVLAKLKDEKTLDVIWNAAGNEKPEIDSYRRRITWRDGSTVTIAGT